MQHLVPVAVSVAYTLQRGMVRERRAVFNNKNCSKSPLMCASCVLQAVRNVICTNLLHTIHTSSAYLAHLAYLL